MAITTYPLNGIDYSAEDAETYLCTRTSGVYSADDNFQATVTGAREVTISKGRAWIQNTDHSGKSVYNSAPVAVTIPAADGTLPRIDRIVLQFDKAANGSSIVLKQGTAKTQPVAPTVSRTELLYELALCDVAVAAGSVSVSSSDVTSTLLDENVCGIMRDGVTTIPTATLQTQTTTLLNSIKSTLSSVTDGSAYVLASQTIQNSEIDSIMLS